MEDRTFEERELELQIETLVTKATKAIESTDQIQSEVNKVAETKKILGKTIDEWISYFKVSIPRGANPLEILNLGPFVSEKLEVAYESKARLETQLTTFLMGYKDLHNGEFLRHALDNKRKTIPKKESLDAIADAKMGELKLVLLRYEKSIDFFQSMIYKLNGTIKTIEFMTISNGTLRKGEVGGF